MIYFYKEITPTIRRPIIQIVVKSQNYFAIYPVLIDSGADYCIFSLELARDLGITLSKTKVGIRSVGRDKVMGRWGAVEIKIGDTSYSTKVLFAKISKFGHGILGQQGFFDHFDVKLNYQKQIIEIDPIEGRYYSV